MAFPPAPWAGHDAVGMLASLGSDGREISCNISGWAPRCEMVKSHHGLG